MNYEEIEIDFITRTEDILRKFSKQTEYEVTLFINCMIGLLIFPKEMHYEKISSIAPLEAKYSSLCHIDYSGSKNVSLQFLVRRIRNSLCHSKWEAISNNDNNISKIIFKDSYSNESASIIIKFEIENLRKFIELFLVDLKKVIKN